MQTILKVEENSAQVKLSGKFEMKARRDFLAVLEQAKAENTSNILIDLREVSYVDSAAIGLLMQAKKQLTTSNKQLTICCNDGYVKKTLDLMKIGTLIPITTSP